MDFEEVVLMEQLKRLGNGITIELYERLDYIIDIVEVLKISDINMVLDNVHYGLVTIAEEDFEEAEWLLNAMGVWWDCYY